MKQKKYEIVFEDDAIVVVDKPAGLLSIPDRFDPMKENLRDLLRQKFGDIHTVHRLDKDTSGVICYAKHLEAQQKLASQFEDRTVSKSYHAIVDGVPEPSSQSIKLPIAHAPGKPGMVHIHKNGKEARTDFEVVDVFGHFAIVNVQLFSGRMHQIRIHFKAIGHPLIVDEKYGKRSAFFLSEIKGRRYRLGKDKIERPLLSRLSLHARHLSFSHPITTESLAFEAPIPKDLAAVEKQLSKCYPKP